MDGTPRRHQNSAIQHLEAYQRDGYVIIREFFLRAVIVSVASVLIGVILSFAFADPLKNLIIPIFAGVTVAQLPGNVITAGSVLIGAVSAIVIGGIFGIFPVFSVLNEGIAEGIREG